MHYYLLTVLVSAGHAITTKKVKAENRWRMAEDITDNYKYPEGSDKERIAVKRALQKVNHPVIKDLPQDVKFSIKVPEEILIGRDANMSVYLENTSRKKLGVVAHVTAQVVRYTGVTLQKLPVQKLTAGLDPFGSKCHV